MVVNKLGGVSFALQLSALAVFAVMLSNILTILFFTGDRADILRSIIVNEATAALTPLVSAVAEDKAVPKSPDVTISAVKAWTPAPDEWQRSETIENQVMAQVPNVRLRVYTPVIVGISPPDVFRQVQKGGPFVAAIAYREGREPVLIVSKLRPDLPPPVAALLSTLGSGLLIVLGTMFLMGRMVKPLRSLAKASERIGQSIEVEPVPVRGPPELRAAAGAFNLMANRIGQLLDRQRSTLWALGHDLRTPVTAMRIRLELVDDDETRERLRASVEEIERVVEDALFLARSGLPSGPAETGFFDDVVTAAVAGLIDAAPEVESRITIKPCPQAKMAMRKGEMVRAVRNLVHNALRHTGGPVHVTVLQPPLIGVVVEDWGPGLPANVLAAPGQPFVRGDKARSSDGSTGLGLAIVRSITEGHGGTLTARPRSDGTGTVISLLFNENIAATRASVTL
jgi:signal transduction histidine kinase